MDQRSNEERRRKDRRLGNALVVQAPQAFGNKGHRHDPAPDKHGK